MAVLVVKFYEGDIINLDLNPTIVWATEPSETGVSLDSEPLKKFNSGETWELVFDVANSDYSVNVQRLAVVHKPSSELIFLSW